MALTLVVNSNTWITLTEANDYIEAIPGSSIWAALSDTEKKQYIITAYRKIKYSREVSISTVTQVLKYAQSEFVYWLLSYMGEWEKRQALYASGVRSFNLPRWSETLEAATLPDFIKDLLSGNLTGGHEFGNLRREND